MTIHLLRFDTLKDIPSVPLFIEVEVHKESAPYLVSGMSKSLIWINSPKEKIRAAFRYKQTIEEFYQEVVEAIKLKGFEENWGNTFSCKSKLASALNKGKQYLENYGITDIEILCAEPKEEMIQCDWVPEGHILILPKDKEFLGVILMLKSVFCGVIHNPSRGLAIIQYELARKSPK
jgi:hypothetical protein